MTSVEIPVSVAAALPNLTVLDITNEVQREISAAGGSGIAFVSPNGDPSLIRVQERETGFFSDLAPNCHFNRLIRFDKAAGDLPVAASTAAGTADQQQLSILNHGSAHAHVVAPHVHGRNQAVRDGGGRVEDRLYLRCGDVGRQHRRLR